MTLSGKTTLARSLCSYAKKQGVGVIVLDPIRDPAWQADFITDNEYEFLRVFWASRSCLALMDEGGESVGRYNLAMQKTATRGRHAGHTCVYVAQKATQLAPIVRDQCTNLFLFTSSARDGKVLAEEWNKPELALCHTYEQYEYAHAMKFGTVKRHNSRGVKHGSGTDNRRIGHDGGGDSHRDGNDQESAREGRSEVGTTEEGDTTEGGA